VNVAVQQRNERFLLFRLAVAWQATCPYKQTFEALSTLFIAFNSSMLQARFSCFLNSIKQRVV